MKGEALNSLREINKILLRPLIGSSLYIIEYELCETLVCYGYHCLHHLCLLKGIRATEIAITKYLRVMIGVPTLRRMGSGLDLIGDIMKMYAF